MLLNLYRDLTVQGNRIALQKFQGNLARVRHISYGGRTITVQPILKPLQPKLLAARSAGGETARSVGISQQAMEQLRLPENIQLHSRLQNNTWYLGPCLGIYVRTYETTTHPFGEQTRLLHELSLMAAEQGVDLVVFGPGFMRSQEGWRYNQKDKGWAYQKLPMPDVIYRRSGAFAADDANLVRDDLQTFAADGRLHTLPRSISNKWKLHQVLSATPELREHLLQTEFLTDGKDLYEWVNRHRDVYAKPLTGAQGASIFHLRLTPAGVQVQWERPRRGLKPRDVLQEVFPSARGFAAFWAKTGPKRFIVQETFQLPRTSDGDPFDLRWLVQYVDEPLVMARVARVGKQGSVTTNIHTGGKPMDAEKLLEQLKWTDVDGFIKRLDDVAVAVAEACRKVFGPIVELGVDLAVAKNGDIRIFEVNSTPGRRMLRLISPDLRKMSLQYLLEYAINATGFAGES